MPRPLDPSVGQAEPTGEIDLSAIGAALKRRRRAWVVPTFLAFVAVATFVTVATPRYTAQSQILLENQETFFTRPDRVNLPDGQANQLDEAAVASQVQLIESPDIVRRAIKALHLEGNSEFDPLAKGMNPVSRMLVVLGVLPDPTRESADARMVQAFSQKLTVFSPPKTRVVTIEFTSRDPELAARGANEIAALYLREQSSAKRVTAKDSADALAAQIAGLRGKLAEADAARERYRSTSGLLAGTNNMTISGQSLADMNTDLSRARSAQADAQAKAATIRDLLAQGRAADVADVTNSPIVRQLWSQRSQAQAQLALESRTLLPEHPRVKELTAQLKEYDLSLKAAAKQAATSLENDSKVAGQRVANLEVAVAQQKTLVGAANSDEVRLNALDRVSQSFKDQLQSSTTKYEEALARQSSMATPADARIISSATPPQEPSYPKKLPFLIFGTLAMLVFSVGWVIAGEILSGRANYDVGPVRVREAPVPSAPMPVVPVVPAPAQADPPLAMPRRRSSDMSRFARSSVADFWAEAPATPADPAPLPLFAPVPAATPTSVPVQTFAPVAAPASVPVQMPVPVATPKVEPELDARFTPERKSAPGIAERPKASKPASLWFSEMLRNLGRARRDDVVLAPLQPRTMPKTTPKTKLQTPSKTTAKTMFETPLKATTKTTTKAKPATKTEPTRTAGPRRRFGGAVAALSAYAMAFGRPASASRIEPVTAGPRATPAMIPAMTPGIAWDDIAAPVAPPADSLAPAASPAPAAVTADTKTKVRAAPDVSERDGVAQRIVASHVPGRGLHVVGTGVGTDAATSDKLIALARTLADKGRSIIVDLNATPAKLATLGAPENGRATVTMLDGLSELLAGESSFAEVIHRDHATRLHFIPTGRKEADFRDFDLILDALTETYDFIVLLTPTVPQSEIAKVMAPYADFMVLSADDTADRGLLASLEEELTAAGAREVLVLGAPTGRTAGKIVA